MDRLYGDHLHRQHRHNMLILLGSTWEMMVNYLGEEVGDLGSYRGVGRLSILKKGRCDDNEFPSF